LFLALAAGKLAQRQALVKIRPSLSMKFQPINMLKLSRVLQTPCHQRHCYFWESAL